MGLTSLDYSPAQTPTTLRYSFKEASESGRSQDNTDLMKVMSLLTIKGAHQ
jgi:hypothetical protein